MTLLRRWRFLYWLGRELAQKHTRSLGFGFIIGFVLSITVIRIWPVFMSRFLTPVDRIAVIGEFTPNSLPLFIKLQLSQGLTTIKPDGSPAPGVADRWEATDSGRLYVFHLNQNLRWQNGQPLKSADINYQIQSVQLKPLDDYTLQIRLQTPYSPFLTLVSRPLFLSGLTGVGPYKLDSLRLKGDKVSYLKLIPGPGGKLKTREYRFYQTEAQAILAYKLGEVDEIYEITSPETLKSWGKSLITENTNYQRMLGVFFNVSDQFLQEKAIRQALSYSMPNFDEERAISPISKTSWVYIDKVRTYRPDPAQAKKLFDSQKTSTHSAQLTITTFAPYVSVAQTIAKNWTAAGVNTEVKVENALPENYQVLLTTIDVPPDPDQYLFWHSTQTQTNISNFANVKIDKLLEDGREQIEPEKRKKIYADFQRYIAEEVPATFLYYAKSYNLKRSP